MANQTWKPIAAGVCSIVGGALGILSGLAAGVMGIWSMSGMPGMWGMWGAESHMTPWGANPFGWFGLPALILGAMAIVGGIFALKRRHWGLSLAGAICATLTPISFILGVPAIVFIALSHDEFEA
ncbi:MAG: hypothetical protein E4G93_01430 [Dehalococcoidia bacterium]|nr:MAG: hypothetical protein E4G93_01430 [Dehalococcoidia bacterium]